MARVAALADPIHCDPSDTGRSLERPAGSVWLCTRVNTPGTIRIRLP